MIEIHLEGKERVRNGKIPANLDRLIGKKLYTTNPNNADRATGKKAYNDFHTARDFIIFKLNVKNL